MNDEDDGEEWTREDSERVASRVRPILIQVALLDRDELVRARRELKRFDAAGPVLDPTAYRERGEANRKAMERLDALVEFYDALDVGDLKEVAES